MSFLNVDLPSVWNIPVMAGVPALLGQSIGAGISASVSTSLGGFAQNWLTNTAAKRWGIFNSSNKNVLSASRVLAMEYENGYSLSSAPQEEGAFISYNKVKIPYSARVAMICDGSETGSNDLLKSIESLVGLSSLESSTIRQSFLSTLEQIVSDTNLYTIVTPDYNYYNCNIVGYRWRRTAENGVTLLVAEIALQEIRNQATATYSSTQTPQGASPVQAGTVQAISPSTQAQNAVAGILT